MAKKSKLKKNANQKANALAYKSQDRATKNRIKRLERTVAAQPTNESAAKALAKLKAGESGFKRCKPKGRANHQKETGIQVIGTRMVKGKEVPIYSYVMAREFKPGHLSNHQRKGRVSYRIGDRITADMRKQVGA